jgi:Peptidase family M23
MASHRTTTRGLLLLLALGVFTGTAQAAVPAVTAFPVVGNATYIDDFGAPRHQGRHEGNDLMSIRHQPTVAFEGGWVEKWARARQAIPSCMLVLHGFSGMSYRYIHLNNDATNANDNDGGCRTAYAPGLTNGQRVKRGQLVGFVGDSGDANGIQPHLHFEIRRPNGTAIDPYRFLRRSVHLLFPEPAGGTAVTLTLKKAKVVATGDNTVTVQTRRVVVSPLGLSYLLTKNVTLSTNGAVMERRALDGTMAAATLADAKVGDVARIWTTSFAPGWRSLRGAPGAITAERVVLGLS